MTSTAQSTNSIDAMPSPAIWDPSLDFDLVCIGFGAAQLATAIANRELRQPLKVLFVERKPSFSWHAGSHVSRTRMENPFMFDLATLRNPRTAFSYVSYLFAKRRLIEFANSDRLNPLRAEFEDYMQWCAEHFTNEVQYGSEVMSVVPEKKSLTIVSWKVAMRDGTGTTSTVRTRSLVAPSHLREENIAPEPLLTVNFMAGQQILLLEDYFLRRNELRGINEPRLNISVIGAGRRILEVLDDLLACPRLGNITIVTEDESLTPLTVLGEQEPPQPQLCSIWARPKNGRKKSVSDASELVQNIYMRAYEKQVETKGQYRLRVAFGKDSAAACSNSNIIIRDTAASAYSNSGLLQSLDTLVLGCRQQTDTLAEVQFKRGAVAEGCRLWLVSSCSADGRSLAKDISLMAGEIVRSVSSAAKGARDALVMQARM